MSISLDKALAIKGWMTEAELTWLAEQAQCHTRIVEVGCWLGRSTRALADNTEGTVVAVDHGEGPSDPQARAECGGRPGDFGRFCANLKDRILDGRLAVVQQPSVKAAEMFVGAIAFDMVFIDADHDYENVRANIKAWLPLIARGGIISGHDYSLAGSGVAKAVDELLPGRQIVGKTLIWYWECQ